MKRIIQITRAVILVFCAPLMGSTTPYFDERAPASFADPLHLTHSKDPMDNGWVPELNGLPNKDQVELLTQLMIGIMKEEHDPRCTSINVHLREMIFQHFVIYQHMLNAQNVYLDDRIAHKWAHVLALILKESSGDSTNITDMYGNTIATFDSRAKLRHWKEILTLTRRSAVQLSDQTNFGLTQTSADRLFVAFRLVKDQRYDTAYLEGREGASTPGKILLNTAIAIRRLVWVYQDFAEGRVAESERRIPLQDINKPEYSEKYQTGLKMALLYCGTRFMFRTDAHRDAREETSKLLHAMASIAYCKLGNQQSGYGKNEVDERCFAEWVTLCPALNIDIATLTPLSYFATQGTGPVCEDTFKRLIIKNPVSDGITEIILDSTAEFRIIDFLHAL